MIAGGEIFIGSIGTEGSNTARVQLYGKGHLLVTTGSISIDPNVGSLEGDGEVRIPFYENLHVGGNNLSTVFSGRIRDDRGFSTVPALAGKEGQSRGGGAISKDGSGTLTLTGENTYSYGTTVTEGILLVSNASGSGTGKGAVRVNGGTLGGGGMIAGAVTVGTNTNTPAFLAPSKGMKKPATLTIQGALTLNDDSTYIYKSDTKRAVSDEVIADGVAVDTGAKFSFRASGNNALTLGQVFTVINNTAATPITGPFHNLPQGRIIVVNGSNLQASYSGGNGNDLTLTVVP